MRQKKTDSLDKFPNAKRVLQLIELESRFIKLEENAILSSTFSQDNWKIREVGRSWGFRASLLEIQELLERED